jgi:hypothetical protein
LEKIKQITFYFAEVGPGRGSENTKKECMEWGHGVD